MTRRREPSPVAALDPEVDRLFDQAFDLSPEDRATLLDAACPDRPDVRRSVEALLRAAEAPAPILARGWARGIAEAGGAGGGSRPCDGGEGAEGLAARLGRGGTSDVFLARRADDPAGRSVAIKLLRAGDDRRARRRFDTECEIQAALEPPGIARYEGSGIAVDGRPYLVLEHVAGMPILEHCARHRTKVRDRLALFGAAYTTVAHAHEKGVIHRDLKPSNLLVTADGSVTLLGFGVAARLGGNGVAPLGAWDDLPFTPAYAAPEQWRGEPASKAVDIYALGVVLYQLSSGLLLVYDAEFEIQCWRPRPNHQPLPPSEARAALARHARSEPKARARLDRIVDQRATSWQRLHATLRGPIDAAAMAAIAKAPSAPYGSLVEMAAALSAARG